MVIGPYDWKPWLTGGKGGMPMGWGVAGRFKRGLVFMAPGVNWDKDLGDVADETDEES